MGLNLSIKGVPEELADKLRRRAERNHRSLQGELMAIIESAAQQPLADSVFVTALAPRAAPLTGLRRGSKTIEQTAAEHLQRFAQPISSGPMAVDIIRAERDSR